MQEIYDWLELQVGFREDLNYFTEPFAMVDLVTTMQVSCADRLVQGNGLNILQYIIDVLHTIQEGYETIKDTGR